MIARLTARTTEARSASTGPVSSGTHQAVVSNASIRQPLLRPMRPAIRLTLLLFWLPLLAQAQAHVSLAGQWEVAFDTGDDAGSHRWLTRRFPHKLFLPGTTDEARLGDSLTLVPTLTRESLYQPARRHRFIGTAWYRRTIDIPANWQGKRIEMFLERVLWQSRVFVDGQEAAGQQESLSTPHRYDLSSLLTPGSHTLLIRIDNTRQYAISYQNLAHAYTDGTQTIWNGAIGNLSLTAYDAVSIRHIRTDPDRTTRKVGLKVELQNSSLRPVRGRLQLTAHIHGKALPLMQQAIEVDTGTYVLQTFYDLQANVQLWDEFSPTLYQLTAEFISDDAQNRSSYRTTFGIRQLTHDRSQLQVNGRRLFLRGTLECAIFPRTGHPPTDRTGWQKVFDTARQYGLNHLRFHSWCPPEAAFDVADSLGFYVQIELPLWSLQVGEDPRADQFIWDEAQRISREYGNHPSFCFWSMGNELEGRFVFLTRLMHQLKQADTRHLYTTTTYSFQPPQGSWPLETDDYFVTQRTKLGWVRGQGIFNQQPPSFTDDYSSALTGLPVPLITHEVGQYALFPNMAEISKYTGVLAPVNLLAIRNDLAKKNLLSLADSFLKASGKLAAILYKEELERILKTKGASGIQLLDLHDFPGQGTADIGLLDAFWDNKGIVTPAEFRQFCAPVVPLLRFAKATYTNQEVFRATAEIANFSQGALEKVTPIWAIRDATGRQLAGGRLRTTTLEVGNGLGVGQIETKLTGIKNAQKLVVTLAIEGTPFINTWSIWVYPDTLPDASADVLVTPSADEALHALAQGRSVLFNPDYRQLKGIEGKFVPVFWSPVHFPDQAATMGLLCDPAHPALKAFPTDFHTNWQWWDLCTKSKSMRLPDNNLVPIVRQIDNFANNRQLASLFEARVGRGRLMVCSFDITNDLAHRPVARQLRYSLLRYMNSDRFAPSVMLSADAITSMMEKK